MKNNCNGITGGQKRLIFIGIFIMLVFVKSFNLCQAQLIFKTSNQTIDNTGYAFAIGDLNNDSIPDIYLSTHFGEAGNPGKIWLNNKSGQFIGGQSIGIENVNHHVAFADLDGDGDIDLFIANDASNSKVSYYEGCPNELWFNDGKGNFTNSGQLLGSEPSNKVTLADIDNDGDIDAAVGNYHPANDPTWVKYKPDEIWLNNGKGIFTLSQKLGYGMSSPSLVDYDTDGDLDAFIQDTLWINDGKGKFAKSNKIFQFGNNVNTIEFGELNNDGHIDAFIGNWNAPAEVWLNDGDYNLVNSGQKLGSLKCANVQLIDIDNDGDLDVYTDNDGGSCKLWINQGGKQAGELGKFSDSGLTLPAGQGVLYDFNNDNKLDAIIGNKIWLNEYQPTSSQTINNNNKICIFPNPTSDFITITQSNTLSQNNFIEVCDLQGKFLIKKSCLNTLSSLIDLTGFQEGIYIINITSGNSSVNIKVLKK
jgi:hypothetical protein